MSRLRIHRARDTKLDRDVALEIRPESFTGDPDRPIVEAIYEVSGRDVARATHACQHIAEPPAGHRVTTHRPFRVCLTTVATFLAEFLVYSSARAAHLWDKDNDIWVADLERGTLTRSRVRSRLHRQGER